MDDGMRIGWGNLLAKEFLPPGSEEAIAVGCSCPVIDNAHGRGCMGGVTDDNGQTVYIFSGDCPLHGDDAMMRARGEKK